MTFRYIGSKARLIDALLPHLGRPSQRGRFVDLFCGTGAVSEAAVSLGWAVVVNDTLASAVTMTAGRLLSAQQVPFLKLGGYASAIRHLNEEPGVEGFLWREYSPASARFCGIERRYFTEENATKLDAMRRRVASWYADGTITDSENTLLLADMLSASNRAANIAGTYGCFLSKWQPQALVPVELIQRPLPEQGAQLESFNLDAFAVQTLPGDVAYLDPPYTKRQYASYYHILETIVLNDEPLVGGICGLRPWKSKASPFCYKRKALDAMTELVERLAASTVLISYSDEGHMNLDDLVSRLTPTGTVELVPLHSVGRYRPNRAASGNGANVTEYVIKYSRRVSEQERWAA